MINDPTKYFVCKDCGNICLKDDAIVPPPPLLVLKNSYGIFKFTSRFCPDCVDGIAWHIFEDFAYYPESDFIAYLRRGGKLHPAIKKKVEEYWKQGGYEFSTIEEALQYRRKIELEDTIVEDKHEKFLKSIFVWIKKIF